MASLFPQWGDQPRTPADHESRRRLLAAGWKESTVWEGTWYAPGDLSRKWTTAEALAELSRSQSSPDKPQPNGETT